MAQQGTVKRCNAEKGYGCIAVDGAVLVVPTGSRLNDDGSVDIGGKHYEQGDTVSLGGGGGDAPPHSPCGTGDYWWG